MHIEELIIDGFKSYATRTVIKGWDPSFTAITGLNGSGKSNILDALCFVLGIDNLKQIRANSLQDLIYKRGQAGINKATVTIIFNNLEKKQSPVGYQECKQIIISRQIVLGGKNKYMINGVNAQQHTVENLFQSVQLNVNNPHFLIMQGRVTKILNMKPQEIGAMIEETAGTRMYEDHKEKAFETIAKKDKKLEEINQALNENINPKLEKLKGERRAFMEFQVLQNELSKMERFVTAYEYYTKRTQYETNKSTFMVKNGLFLELQGNMKEKAEHLVMLQKSLDRLKAEKRKRTAQHEELEEAESKVREFEGLLAQLQSRVDILERQQKENHATIKKIIAQKDTVGKQDSSMDKISIEKQFDMAKEEYEEKKLDLARLEELLNSLKTGFSSCSTSGSSKNKTGQVGYDKLISDENALLIQFQAEYEKNKLRMGTLDQFLQDIQGRVPELQRQSDAMKKGMLLDEAKLERLREKIVAVGQVSHEEKELIRRKSLLEKDMQSIGNLALPEFNYKEPFKGFSHENVHGLVYSLFTVPEVNKEWFEALELAGGGKLYNVIVETEREASALLENGGLKKRVTILPLNKIQGYRIPRDKVERMKKAVGTNAFLALDLIKYDSSMTPALEYVFGSTILCRNKETAALLAYDKSAGFNMKCITMDGDVYDPSGTLTGGSSTKSGLSADGLLELKSKHDQRKFIENELGSLNESLSKLQDPRSSSAEIERQIELLVHSISLKKKQLISDISVTALNSYQSQQRELADLIAFQDDLTSRIRASMSKIEGYKRDNSEYLNCRDKETKLVDLEKKIQMIKGNELPKLEKLFQKFKFQKDTLVSSEMFIKDELCKLNLELEAHQNENILLATQEKELRQRDILVLQLELDGFIGKVSQIKERIEAQDNDLTEAHAHIATLKEEQEFMTREHEKLEVDLQKIKDQAVLFENSLQKIVKKDPWVEHEYSQFNVPSGPYDFHAKDMTHICRQLGLQKESVAKQGQMINTQVLDMIGSVEAKQSHLMQNLAIIKEDKVKIEKTIEKLNVYKKEALEKTFHQVNKDFGEIFGELVPTGFAKLEPIAPAKKEKVAEEQGASNSLKDKNSLKDHHLLSSLEIKVRLGSVWKPSLSELSGGQRSLIALSLLFCLLLTKPAPLYLLDEIDAALDLSHTQTIGKLVNSSRFKGSQFIIISLKDGLFNNAPVLFRTQFKEGVSMVQKYSQGKLEGKSPAATTSTIRVR